MSQSLQKSAARRAKKHEDRHGVSSAHDALSSAVVIKSYLSEGASLRLSTVSLSDRIGKAAELVAEAFRNGCKLMTFGNGGSAADAQHIAAEFSGQFQIDRDALPALALTVNSSSLTAIANDYSFEEIFARQIRGLAKAGDVALAISTSGRSRNVLKGLEAAREMGAHTIGMCGSRGEMARRSDILLAVPSETTSLLQEVHIAIGHLLCLLVERDLFG